MEGFIHGLGSLDLAVIGIYLVGTIALGIWLGRRHETAEDFFLAGRGMIWPVIGFSLFASNISSSTLVGLAGDAYGAGISVYNYEWMAAVVLVVFAIFFLPVILRARVYTMPEFLARRYSGAARTYFSLLTLFLNIVVDTAGGLYAGSLILKMIFPDLSIPVIIAGLALAAGIYTAFGGLKAVMVTDVVQAVLLIIGSVVISWAAWHAAGGWEAMTAVVPAAKLSLIRPVDDPAMPWPGLMTGAFLLGFYFWCANQFMVQRVLSARTLDHGRFGALFAGALKLPVLFIMVLPGSFALVLYPDLPRADLVYPTLMFDLLPTGLLGLVLAGFIAALMSQIDSTLNSASTLVTMDFVRRLRPDFDAHRLMRVGQVTTVVVMLLAVAWAPQIARFESLFRYLQVMLAYSVPPIVALYVVGVFWPRANARGAHWALILGSLAGLALLLVNEVWADQRILHFLYVAPILFVISAVVLVLASLTAPAPEREEIADLLWSRATWAAESAELAAKPWWRNYRILSLLLIAATAWVVAAFW